jgi:dTDP-4-dehydrorhamnose reductase
VLVLGANGMLGHVVTRFLAQSPGFTPIGCVRSTTYVDDAEPHFKLLCGVDVLDPDSLESAFERADPQIVVNCVGIVKQLAQSHDPLIAIPLNSLLPHRLVALCRAAGARLVHISTDCVFAGTKGMYRESDVADAADLYGLSKHLGEVGAPGAVTLRTSIIGPELGLAARGLVAWFLSQAGPVKGYTRAMFSGLPTVELARVIRDFVIADTTLEGLYHVAAERISKHNLLRLVADVYGRSTEILPDDTLEIDRSLDGTRFCQRTGYRAPSWPALVQQMYEFG